MSTRYSRRNVNNGHGRHKSTGIKRIAVVFLFTLSIVLLVGLAALAYLKQEPKADKAEAKNSAVNTDLYTTAIPEKKEVAEQVTENEQEAELISDGEPADDSKYGDVIEDEEYLQANNIFVKDGYSSDTVTLGFCGDILFDDEYACMSALKLRGGNLLNCMSEVTIDAMNSVDVMVVNNEFPFTSRGNRQEEKMYTFRADPDTAEYLQIMGADVAILANNHVYDFGEQGLLDTLDTLNEYGIKPLGAGRNIEEASRPVYYIINDIKVAIIAATQIERLEPPNTIGAREDKAGVFRCWNSKLIYSVVEEAKKNADFVIVCVHWGTEKEEMPDTWQLEMAPKLAEAGADLIIGDHPHRLQGFYYYGNTPCIYSLGNYWFNGYKLDTCLVTVEFNKAGMKSLKFLPAIQENMKTNLVGGSEYERIINYMNSISKGAYIDEEGEVCQGDKKTIG